MFDIAKFGYLAALVISIAGLAALDLRHRLALAVSVSRTLITLGLSVAFFLIWDAFGVALGVFFRGQTAFLTGVLVAPEIPLEEVFFLTLLCYSALLLYVGLARLLSKQRGAE